MMNFRDLAKKVPTLRPSYAGLRRRASDAERSIGLDPAHIMKSKGATNAQVAEIEADIAGGFGRVEAGHGLRVPITMTLLSARAPA
jgi:hypothetical protein